jgi:hypothetical protein
MQLAGLIIFVGIVISFLPGYSMMPAGLKLIDYETRYGWTDLGPTVISSTDSDARFIVDRATEFSWLTGRESAKPTFSNGASVPRALASLQMRAALYDATYFVLDGYTVAAYRTLEDLLRLPLAVTGAVPLNPRESNYTEYSFEVPSLVLKYQTPPNQDGDYTRLFHLETSIFTQTSEVNFLDVGWAVGSGGSISNESGLARIEVGEGSNYTFTVRANPFDLDLTSASGFMYMRFSEHSATVARVEFYDATGKFVGYSSDMGSRGHFFFSGDVTVGDIRVIVEGQPGGYVTAREMTLWQKVQP